MPQEWKQIMRGVSSVDFNDAIDKANILAKEGFLVLSHQIEQAIATATYVDNDTQAMVNTKAVHHLVLVKSILVDPITDAAPKKAHISEIADYVEDEITRRSFQNTKG
jgi:hypothetical protein